ncbi:MAG: Rpn family recombination-promoting nuclease/putative transposase [Turicibacter sp.]|nr:Rpn family recombination-promoting nuclease/putative transposase [Turicibacter sp.]
MQKISEVLQFRLVNDALFKIFFSKDEGVGFLKHFLSAALKIPFDDLWGIRVLNPELTGEQIKEKSVILDILLELRNGTKIQVEIQVAPHRWFEHRLIYQNAKLITEQIERGDDSWFLEKRISLVLMDFQLGTNPEGKFQRKMMWRDEAGIPLTDVSEIHVIELPRIPDSADSEELNWYKLFKAGNVHELKQIASTSKVMGKAVEHLEHILASDEARKLAEARDYYRRTENDLWGGGYDYGKLDGIAEGIAQEAQRAYEATLKKAEAALAKGWTIQEISEIFELDLETAQRLLQ